MNVDPPRFRARTFWMAGTAIVILIVAALFLVVAGRESDLSEQVAALQEQAPDEALQLLEDAITAAGGSYPDAQVMKCQLLGRLQGWRAAEQYYDLIDSPEASDQQVLLELAIAANRNHAAWLAAKALEAANHAGPQQEKVLRQLLSVKYDLGEKAAVLRLCHELARWAPTDPEPWLVSAGIHHEMEQFSAALAAYQEALDRSPPGQEALRVRFQIADVSLHLGDLETAERQLQILRDLTPKMPLVGVLYAKLLRRRGENARAKAIAEEIVAQEPRFAAALMLRGQLRFDEGGFREAAADFRAVVTINPYDHKAHYQLGQAYQRLEMTEESEQHFKESRRLTDAVSQTLILGRQLDQNPTSREVRLKLAEQYQILGDVQSAEHWRRTAEGLSARAAIPDSSPLPATRVPRPDQSNESES